MSVQSVKEYFKDNNLPLKIIETTEDTSTVEKAAKALGVQPDMIAKTLAFELKEKEILILTKGRAKTDNRKFKDYFKQKPKFVKYEKVEEVTGHPIGGVCPFGLPKKLDIYLDISLKEFTTVYPAGGSPNSAVEIDVEYLAEVTKGIWIDITKDETI
ncbi:YbaK/EbsC family protein [Psychrilyobacter atlanticus]|uniref:YbaK/EbsC family protein n=1 Tax=Psychrilyobacter atlanticus TaxID=271091 RepID=UPI0004183C3A|nr:YbaK/EbsC family protein [Psychrilyobacter atlanticus]